MHPTTTDFRKYNGVVIMPPDTRTDAEAFEDYKTSMRALRALKDRHIAGGCPCNGKLSYLAIDGREVTCRHEFPEAKATQYRSAVE